MNCFSSFEPGSNIPIFSTQCPHMGQPYSYITRKTHYFKFTYSHQLMIPPNAQGLSGNPYKDGIHMVSLDPARHNQYERWYQTNL